MDRWQRSLSKEGFKKFESLYDLWSVLQPYRKSAFLYTAFGWAACCSLRYYTEAKQMLSDEKSGCFPALRALLLFLFPAGNCFLNFLFCRNTPSFTFL
jgi:hypothetical protein